MKGKTKKTHLRIKTPRKLHQAQDPGFQIKTLHLVVDIHIYIYIYVCMSRPTPNKNFKFSCRHTYICMYVCMYVKAHTRGFSFCFSSFLRLLVLPSIQSNQSINTELDVTIRWFTSKMKFFSPARRERERERERDREKAISPFFPCGRVLSVLFLYLLDWLLVIVF